MNVLPEYKGYTVDFRLRDFRRVTNGRRIEFIDFDSEQGMDLLIQIAREHLEYDL